MRFKKIMALCMTVAMVASLAGCGGKDSASTGSGETDTNTSADAGETADAGSEEDAQPEVAPGKKGTIEFWTVFTGADAHPCRQWWMLIMPQTRITP